MTGIPASKIAEAALHQVKQAADYFPQSYHDSDKVAKAKVHLQVAAELLSLIAEPKVMVNVREDGGIEPILPPAPFPPDPPDPLVRGLDD